TGFCWGGRITWLYAAHNPQLKAAVAWYGKLVGEKSLNSPKHPVDIAVDPIEGTRMTAMGQANALAVMAVGDKGCFLNAPDMYM
ncbi:fructose-bisphosphatase class II, partial [Acinetobacter baumannii]|uniref:fructose-bisphosphatase class II n=1 Tax=Acinetobacter baumannii TaxID=470 RepID=UPI00288CC6CE